MSANISSSFLTPKVFLVHKKYAQALKILSAEHYLYILHTPDGYSLRDRFDSLRTEVIKAFNLKHRK